MAGWPKRKPDDDINKRKFCFVRTLMKTTGEMKRRAVKTRHKANGVAVDANKQIDEDEPGNSEIPPQFRMTTDIDLQ